jgi:uncharacterized protein
MAIDQLVVKIVQRCNLNCSYCYMYQHVDKSYKTKPLFLSPAMMEVLAQRLESYCKARPGHKIDIILHGGEPMLYDVKEFYLLMERLLDRAGQHISRIAMQSNGTLLTPEWIKALHDFKISVGISIDGPQEIHDAQRRDHAGRGSHARTLESVLCLQSESLLSGALCVIQPGIDGLRVYEHMLANGIKRMNFLFPDATHDSKALYYGHIGRASVARYLLPIFDRWFADDDPTICVIIFEDIIRGLLGAKGSFRSFGSAHQGFFVIDTDGMILTTDVLKVCDSRFGASDLNIQSHNFDEFPQSSLTWQVLNDAVAPSSLCRDCTHLGMCHGGALPHRFSQNRVFDNPSIWCEDIIQVLEHVQTAISSYV